MSASSVSDISQIPKGLERRREDIKLITGRGYYVDDLRPPDGRPSALSMAVVRSPYAHATITRIQLDAARALPGVVAAFTGAELVSEMAPLNAFTQPDTRKPDRRPMALGRARYVGDSVAVVLAENSYTAIDARDMVEVDYEPLPAVADPEKALAPDAPLLYPEFGSNIASRSPLSGGDLQDAFKRADHTIRLRLVNQRLSPSSMEPRVCMFDYDATSGQLTAWLSTQAVYRAREILAGALGIERSHIRVYNAEVGGGFGAKTNLVGEEIVAAALSVKLGRPVKWVEDRSENLQAQTHARGQINYVEAAFQNDGRLLALKVRTIADLGAFLSGATAMVPNLTQSMLCGPYRVEAVDSEIIGVFTNKIPTTAYRGAGRPEAAYILERVMDQIARELKLDPVEVRRRNFIPPDAFPYATVTGTRYDSGDYEAALDKGLALLNYAGWRVKQHSRQQTDSHQLLGIGISTFVEISGDSRPVPNAPREAATVRIRRDGSILVQSGVSTNGQGHFTAFTQIAAAVFQTPVSKVEIQMNDSLLPGYSIGTFGSRTTQVAGSTVLLAAQAAREKALKLAAQVLEAAPDDLVMEDGKIMVRGVPARVVELGELARMVEERPELIERDAPNPINGTPIEGLAAWRDFAPEGAGFSSGAHLAVVEVDTDTGETRILTYVAVDDCGRVLNQYLAEAQVHGALAQGIGQALFEEVVYDDESGQLLTTTLMDYALPIADQLPTFVTANVETPSPRNPLGAKGVGEAGCIGGPPAIVNAVLDALAPLGITTIDMPLRPEKIWAQVHAARQGTLSQAIPEFPSAFSA
ncbi:MAG TPA: xanthine dehydrogenase family protein molybdopterin-binding subunit [Ktedonosporobacter sp.]|jgi:carbon-monoxide dehydrogenase large subunit|nr:xanthine dehydrogenase family protein molybdopterin-binding subunit [Ktedonosporobacter sp.]